MVMLGWPPRMPMMASPRPTRRPLERFRLALPSCPRALAPRGGHIALRARSFARRLRFLCLAFRGPRLIHCGRRDPLRGLLRPSAPLEIGLDVVVLALAFVGPGSLWHSGHLPHVSRARGVRDQPPKRAASIVSRSAIR